MLEWLMDNADGLVMALMATHAAASAITALTPTPRDDAWVAGVYRWIERIALVVGRAKEGGK